MATKKISELEAITEADGSDVLAIVDVSEGKTNKITKNNLLKSSGHTIEMSLNENYQIVLKLKNAEGTELSTATIDLPNENAITNISYSNGTLTLTKQSGTTSQVDISGLINGLATETALTNLANALKETIGIDTNTYNESQTYNTGDIVIQNEKIYKANQDNITGTFDSSKWDEISLYEYQKLQDEAIEENYEVITKLQEDVEDLTERVEDAENNEITNTPTPATSHYLQDSAGSRFRKFIPIGRTTQESTTGKNKLPATGRSGGSNGVITTLNKDGSMAISGTSTANWFVIGDSSDVSIPAGEYTFSTKEALPFNIRLNCTYEDDATASLWTITKGNTSRTVTIEKAIKKIFIETSGATSGTTYNLTLYLQLEGGSTASDWEKYTGGEPAPNPKYPIAIKNTGDNGSVNEKVQNKNLFDEEIELGNISADNGTLSNSTTRTRSKNFIKVKPNTTYTCIRTTGNIRWIIGYTKDKVGIIDGISEHPSSITSASSAILSFQFTTTPTTEYIKWYDISCTDLTEKVQIEENPTATDYVPHSEQNLSFPLSQGQKFYEGSHPADDEKVHHVRGEVVLDGTVGGYNGDYNWFYLSFTNLQIQKPKTLNILSNYFKYYNRNEFANDTSLNGISFNTADISTASTFVIRNTNCTNATEYKNWLAEVLPKVIYELAEEQTEDFTEEQKTAYPEWKKARTYKNITHISSEDETPANVEIEYVVDINTIDDRITALEAKVDLLEE